MLASKTERNSPLHVGVVGYGSWATALVKLLSENVPAISWCVRNEAMIAQVRELRRNPYYLRSTVLPVEKLHISCDVNEVVASADVLLVATPSAFLPAVMRKLTVSLKDKLIVSAIKGLLPETNVTVAEYFNEEYGIPFDNIGIIAGPCHAEEVSLERLSYLTFCCKSEKNARALADLFATPYIKTITGTDIYGIEYASVLKNIYAIATGICHGIGGYGDNFTAVLISNAHSEMKRFLNQSYPSERNTSDSVYLGDLLVTCYSQFSRNRTFGGMIGKGYSVKSAQVEMNMVAEGYYAVKGIHEINKRYNIPMPIADAVYNILYEKISPSIEIALLAEKLC